MRSIILVLHVPGFGNSSASCCHSDSTELLCRRLTLWEITGFDLICLRPLKTKHSFYVFPWEHLLFKVNTFAQRLNTFAPDGFECLGWLFWNFPTKVPWSVFFTIRYWVTWSYLRLRQSDIVSLCVCNIIFHPCRYAFSLFYGAVSLSLFYLIVIFKIFTCYVKRNLVLSI